jgi:hypothetical protein
VQGFRLNLQFIHKITARLANVRRQPCASASDLGFASQVAREAHRLHALVSRPAVVSDEPCALGRMVPDQLRRA